MKRFSKILCCTLFFAGLASAVPKEAAAQSPFKPKGVFSNDSAVHQFDGSRWQKLVQVSVDSLTTTDANYQTIRTIEVATNEVGIITVGMIGINDSLTAAVTGEQVARYAKVNGTLTMTASSATLTTTTDSDLSGATWDISTSGNQIIVRVKGRNTYRVRWEADIRRRRIIKQP